MKSLVYLFAVFFSVFLFAQETETVTVIGEASIINNDKIAAKDKAIDDALRKAVEQITGTVVSSESLTENFELVKDTIYTKSKGYVQKHKIIEHGIDKQDSGVYFVKIEAVVSKGKIQEDYKGIVSMYESLGKPKFLILISEQNIGEKTASGWWTGSQVNLGNVENGMVNLWLKEGFKFVDYQVLSKKIKVLPAFQNVNNLTDKDVKEITDLHDADFIIYGQAIATITTDKTYEKMEGVTPKYAYATLTVKVVSADTGEIVVSEDVEGYGSNVLNEIKAGKEAFKNLAKNSVEKINSVILDKWKERLYSNNEISIKIKGLTDIKKLKALKGYLLDEVRGVISVSDFKIQNKEAIFTVSFKGLTKLFMDEITNKPFKDVNLSIEEITRHQIIFTLEK